MHSVINVVRCAYTVLANPTYQHLETIGRNNTHRYREISSGM